MACPVAFSPHQLRWFLESLPPVEGYQVALSGGLDSTVLLEALCRVHAAWPECPPLRAVHVHHGLQARADHWVTHCRALCDRLGVALDVVYVDVVAHGGAGPEAAARTARYAALAERLAPGECLLTAHHQDDQAETLLLQLLRGSGPRGLAAMPPWAVLGRGLHARPLLASSRSALRGYAQARGLTWVDDPSNATLAFDRNFLRHEIMPRLTRRWSGVAARMARAARHCAEASHLLDALARLDLAPLRDALPGRLDAEGLRRLEPARQRNALRAWLRELGLPVPGTRQLHQALHDVMSAQWDATPCIRWPGAELRRYRDRVYAMAPLSAHDPHQVMPWDLRQTLALPGLAIRLVARATRGQGLGRAACEDSTITVRFRRGGERCRPAGRGHTHALKKLFQERGVPPWERDRIPLIYADDQLAAVADWWVCEPFAADEGEPGYAIQCVSSAACSD